MIQAAFFDIDGTLYDHGAKQVPPSTLSSLSALQKKGVKLFIATGRIPATVGFIWDMFPFDGCVAVNGQLAVKQDGTVLHRMAYKPEDARHFLTTMEQMGFPCLIVEEREIFALAPSPAIDEHFRYSDVPPPPLYDFTRLASHPILQFNTYLPWAQRASLQSLPYLEVTDAGGMILDLIPKEGGKEVGIQAATDYFGFSRENILVFGDGDNDVRMLRWAGIGVAMGNGSAAAKEAADYITAPVGEDGIREALLHLGILSPEEF